MQTVLAASMHDIEVEGGDRRTVNDCRDASDYHEVDVVSGKDFERFLEPRSGWHCAVRQRCRRNPGEQPTGLPESTRASSESGMHRLHRAKPLRPTGFHGNP